MANTETTGPIETMERGPNGYPIKYMTTTGDYRDATPTEIYFGASREAAETAYSERTSDEFPQLFAIEVDYRGDFRDVTRLSTDWTKV